jgi:hypothetical protein
MPSAAVTSGPRATTWPMPLGDKPSHGARELTNKVRQPPLRRPHDSRRRSPRPRRPAASSRRLPLPVTTNSPVYQLMSSTDRAATSPRRDPSRASTVRIAASGAGPPITTLQHPRDLIHGDRAHHIAVRQPEASLAGGALQDVGDTFVDTPTLLADSDVVTTPKLTT